VEKKGEAEAAAFYANSAGTAVCGSVEYFDHTGGEDHIHPESRVL
jgi:hypothetical protein